MCMYRMDGVSVVHSAGKRLVRVLDGLDLEIEAGEFLTLVGPSGSGKTTLLNLMAGFQRPSAGTVLFGGRDLWAMTAVEAAQYRNRDLGMIHQFFNLLPDLSALRNVMLPAMIGGCGRREAAHRAEALLERVGVLARAAHYPSELSGGEQQRVAIARALMNDPKVVLGDEPTGNLDAVTTEEILRLLGEIHAERGTLLVLATHDQRVAGCGSRIIDVGSIVAA